MNGSDILQHHRNNLTGALSERGDKVPEFAPLCLSPWVAMSLMQKAIRRGRTELALGAAATLLEGSPPRLWRRLCVTAYEDVGVGDFETVALVTAGLAGKTWRAKVGGEWAVASYLVERMCDAVKCRAADDLVVVAECHPDLERARLDLTFKLLPQLIKLGLSKASLPERALALWFGTGTNQYNTSRLRERRGDPQAVFDALCEAGLANDVVEVSREGFRKGAGILAPCVALLHHDQSRTVGHVEPDDLLPEETIRGVPCWTLDMHTRPGKAAIGRFLNNDSDTSRWLRGCLPKKQHSHVLSSMLFGIEGGLVDRRLRWETGDWLLLMARTEVYRLPPEEVSHGQALLRNDLPILNEERRHVAASNLR